MLDRSRRWPSAPRSTGRNTSNDQGTSARIWVSTPATLPVRRDHIQGKVSRCGDELARTALYEAAHRSWSQPQMVGLRAWASGSPSAAAWHEPASLSLAKLAMILHRMWCENSEFRFGEEPAAYTVMAMTKTQPEDVHLRSSNDPQRRERKRSRGDDGQGDLVESPEPGAQVPARS